MGRREERNGGSFKVGSLLAGVLIGGLVAAGIALVKAPQSGEETVRQIRQKAEKVGDKAEEVMLGAQARLEKVGAQVAERATDIRANGATVAKDAQEHLQKAVEGI